jgi:hypothetical protein
MCWRIQKLCGAGRHCWTFATLIREALGRRRVGVAVQPSLQHLSPHRNHRHHDCYDVSDDCAAVVITVNSLYSW